MITIGTIKISKGFYVALLLLITLVLLILVLSTIFPRIVQPVFLPGQGNQNEGRSSGLWIFMMERAAPFMRGSIQGKALTIMDYLYLSTGVKLSNPSTLVISQLPFIRHNNGTTPVIQIPERAFLEDYGENTYQDGTINFSPEVIEELRQRGLLNEGLMEDPLQQKSITVIPNEEVPNPGKPRVLIYHTHITEAYLPSGNGNFQIDDWRHSLQMEVTVSSVGEVMANALRNLGIGVIHDRTIHDYPSAVGSYARSKRTIQQILKENPTIEIVLDIHRDALGPPPKGDIQFSRTHTTTEINGQKVARILLFLGTGHSAWRDNMSFARQFRERMEELYPGLSRNISQPHSIMTREGTYNQDVSKKALLLEVGSIGNTVDEAKRSAMMLAEVVASFLK